MGPSDQDWQRARLADLHAALEVANGRILDVHNLGAWKSLGYPDWDNYVQAEVLPRLLQGAYGLLRPSLAVYSQRRTGNVLDHVVNGLLDQAGRLVLSTPPEELEVQERQIPMGRGQVYRSPVSELDLAVQTMLVDGLRDVLGHDVGVFAEEGPRALEALERATCILVDPIDRTRELLLGRRGYSINLAVIRDGAVLGWTDFPALGWRFQTTPHELWFNGRVLEPVPPWPNRVTVAVNPAHRPVLPDRLGPDDTEVLMLVTGGVSYRLALLALGIVQAVVIPPTPYPRFALWDWLPLGAGLEHVRIEVTGWQGEDLLQQRPAVWAGGMLAGNREVCARLRAVLPNEMPRGT